MLHLCLDSFPDNIHILQGLPYKEKEKSKLFLKSEYFCLRSNKLSHYISSQMLSVIPNIRSYPHHHIEFLSIFIQYWEFLYHFTHSHSCALLDLLGKKLDQRGLFFFFSILSHFFLCFIFSIHDDYYIFFLYILIIGHFSFTCFRAEFQ